MFFRRSVRAATVSVMRRNSLCKAASFLPRTVVHVSWSWWFVGLPCALPGREVLLVVMAVGCVVSPGRCPPDGSCVGRQGAWGRGGSRFACSPADVVGGARAPRCPPPARTLLRLAPGAWLPEWLGDGPRCRGGPGWGRCGPGFWASPIRAPSCQSCDRRSPLLLVLVLELLAASCTHPSMMGRRWGPQEA